MLPIHTIDLNFPNFASSIATYAIPHTDGVALVDPGPESTLESLTAGLAGHGLQPDGVTHVLLTHIHLDHAGAAGWFAARGAQIFVHPAGAPHLLDPGKLLASARRIYAERMDELWGPFRPVEAVNLTEVRDGAEIAAGGLRFIALHTPGHAEHHVAYLFEDTCFTGDVGGVRMAGRLYLRLPFVPPETHLGRWRASLARIRAAGPRQVASTHFGIYDDAEAHLDLAARLLDEVEGWLETVMPEVEDAAALYRRYVPWLHECGRILGLDEATLVTYDQASLPRMAADGLFRYWHKVRLAEK